MVYKYLCSKEERIRCSYENYNVDHLLLVQDPTIRMRHSKHGGNDAKTFTSSLSALSV